jgi:hypothetical protein
MIPVDTNAPVPAAIALPPPSMDLITSDRKIERAWYLCLRQIIGQIGGFTAPPLSVSDLQILGDENLDIATADLAGVPGQFDSLAISALDLDLNEAPSRQDVADALLIANAALDNADASITGFANPSATVGLTIKPGVAQTAMRSDAAPALDVTIAPTWTGAHIFNAAATLKATFGSSVGMNAATMVGLGSSAAVFEELLCSTGNNAGILFGVNGVSNGANVALVYNAGTPYLQVATAAATSYLSFLTQSAERLRITAAGTAQFINAIGVNNVAPPAQVTGFGTPTGAAVIANFPGATATLVQCSNTIAELITVLKAIGFLGA